MDFLETNTHSFIVKIWLEETAEEAGQAVWRGHITHVPSSKRRYFQDLENVPLFIAPYLQEMGVDFRPPWRLKRWLKWLELYLMKQA
jgi:hypothetical protein